MASPGAGCLAVRRRQGRVEASAVSTASLDQIARLDLRSLELLAQCDPADVDALADRLEPVVLDAGDVLMRQGDLGTTFGLVVDGALAVRREQPEGGTVEVARVGPGSIIGEVALLTGRRRMASVVALAPTSTMMGDADSFGALLDLPGVADTVSTLVATRLAADAQPVPVDLGDGTTVAVRPLLPADRSALESGLGRLSPESLRRRFFSGGQPSRRVIDYLVDINYLDHFAWVALRGDAAVEGVASARYIRDGANPQRAEIAFGVIDAYQGRGIGTVLLGALGAAARTAGLRRFEAQVLDENVAMRAVLDKAGVQWRYAEPGVLMADFDVDAAAEVIDGDLSSRFTRTAREIVTTAMLALTRPGSGMA
jgi:protein lysine acetyltransferase